MSKKTDSFLSFLEKHNDRILSTEPMNEEAVLTAVRDIYRLTDLDEPQVLFLDSPWQLAHIIHFLGALENSTHYREDPEKLKQDFIDKNRKKYSVLVSEETLESCVESQFELLNAIENEPIIDSLLSCYQRLNRPSVLACYEENRDSPQLEYPVAMFAPFPSKMRFLHVLNIPKRTPLLSPASRAGKEEREHEIATRRTLQNHSIDYRSTEIGTIKVQLDELMGSLLTGIPEVVYSLSGGNPWFDSLPAEKFLVDQGVSYPDRARAYINAFYDLTTETNLTFFWEDFCLISNRPVLLELNNETRLHNEEEAALIYQDLFKLFSKNGKNFVFEKF